LVGDARKGNMVLAGRGTGRNHYNENITLVIRRFFRS
jgi:hypothetical protein